MKKEKLMLILLVFVMSVMSSTVFAEDYRHTRVEDGYYYQAIGQCESNSLFGSSSWRKTDENARVYVTYQTYTKAAEGEVVEVEFGISTPTAQYSSINKTVSLYSIAQVEFVHFAKTEEYDQAVWGPCYVTP